MATYTVTTISDIIDPNDGVLSLREAVDLANATTASDTIEFAPLIESQTPLAVALYLNGELEQARAAAELGKGLCCGFGYATLALTEAGHAEAARAALDEAQRQSTLLARDPTGFWGNLRFAADVTDRLNSELAKAGLHIPPSPPSGDTIL